MLESVCILDETNLIQQLLLDYKDGEARLLGCCYSLVESENHAIIKCDHLIPEDYKKACLEWNTLPKARNILCAVLKRPDFHQCVPLLDLPLSSKGITKELVCKIVELVMKSSNRTQRSHVKFYCFDGHSVFKMVLLIFTGFLPIPLEWQGAFAHLPHFYLFRSELLV